MIKPSSIKTRLTPREKDIGEFSVRRALPFAIIVKARCGEANIRRDKYLAD